MSTGMKITGKKEPEKNDFSSKKNDFLNRLL
jgi:hypothetical protein